VRLLTVEHFPVLPLTLREFVKAFTSELNYRGVACNNAGPTMAYRLLTRC
jgi:hypothetical protein